MQPDVDSPSEPERLCRGARQRQGMVRVKASLAVEIRPAQFAPPIGHHLDIAGEEPTVLALCHRDAANHPVTLTASGANLHYANSGPRLGVTASAKPP